MVGQIMVSVATAAIYSLGIPYLDENINREDTPVYIGNSHISWSYDLSFVKQAAVKIRIIFLQLWCSPLLWLVLPLASLSEVNCWKSTLTLTKGAIKGDLPNPINTACSLLPPLSLICWFLFQRFETFFLQLPRGLVDLVPHCSFDECLSCLITVLFPLCSERYSHKFHAVSPYEVTLPVHESLSFLCIYFFSQRDLITWGSEVPIVGASASH